MRNIFSLQMETKVSLAIILIVAIIFLVAVFKSLDNFNEINNRINQHEKIRVQESP